MRKAASVQLNIAEFAFLVAKMPDEEKIEWLNSLAECLAFSKPELNEFGASLLQEVEMFKKNDRERKARKKKLSKESSGIRGKDNFPESPDTDRQTDRQTDSKKTSKKALKPDDVSDECWDEFVAHRKKKKTDITDRVISAFRNEANKAGISLEKALDCVVFRGWIAFKADWYNKDNEYPQETKPQRRGYRQ
jgi:hypothetical protein